MGVHPPQCTIRFFPPLPFPPSFLPRLFFFVVLNIHLLAGLWWCQLASQSFSFHTGDTQPQHVQRFQTHLKSVHKRKRKKHHKHAAFTTDRCTLTSVHTANRTDNMATSPALLSGWTLKICRPISDALHKLFTHTIKIVYTRTLSFAFYYKKSCLASTRHLPMWKIDLFVLVAAHGVLLRVHVCDSACCYSVWSFKFIFMETSSRVFSYMNDFSQCEKLNNQ